MKINLNFDHFLCNLALLFIGLKLAGIINWSWFWVLSPVGIPVAVVLLFLLYLTLTAWWAGCRVRRRF